MDVNNQIKKSNLKTILKEMFQIVYKNKRKIKIQSISPIACANPLRAVWLWKDFLKENINVTNNKKFQVTTFKLWCSFKFGIRPYLYN